MNNYKIKLCLVNYTFYPIYAGPAIRFQRYSLGFDKKNIEMNVFTNSYDEKSIKKDGTSSLSAEQFKQKYKNIKITRVKTHGRKISHYLFFKYLYNYCKKKKLGLQLYNCWS